MKHSTVFKMYKFLIVFFLFAFITACTETTDSQATTAATTVATTVATTNTTTATTTSSTTTSTTTEHLTYNLLDDGVKWSNPVYVYAQENGSNPLEHVEYDKGANTYPVLSKDITFDTSEYQKLVLSIKGQYYIQMNIISKENESSNEVKQSLIFELDNQFTYYEIDLNFDGYTIYKDHIIRIEWIVAPGKTTLYGDFAINNLTFDNSDMTIDTYTNDFPDPIINVDDGGLEAFSFNQHWYEAGYSFKITEESAYHTINYSVFPESNSFVRSGVSGDFSDYDYINFRFKGDVGTKLTVTIASSTLLETEVKPEYELTLDGEFQYATLYLDELSAATRNNIYEIRIYVEAESLIPVTGQFEIYLAEFSNVAMVEKPVSPLHEYPGDGQTFSFNSRWVTENSLVATFTEDDGDVTVTYEKQFLSSAIYSFVDGYLSDFDYINVRIVTEPYAEFLFKFDTRWSYRLDHQLTADENGVIEFTMSFGLHYFDEDIDNIEGFRIIPNVNQSDSSGEFTIEVAEFSNTPLVTYDVTDEISIDMWHQIGDVFTIDQVSNVISWDALEGYTTLYSRVFGPFVQSNEFVYKYVDFEAIVDSDVMIEFEVDGAKYLFTLTPSQTLYRIVLAAPNAGTADTWKFSEGFGFNLKIDTTTAGSIILSSLDFNNEAVAPSNVIDFNIPLLNFNGMTATSVVNGDAIDVTYTKTQANSLVYYLINSTVKAGSIASDYRFINFRITSSDTTEFLIELSGYSSMTHYVTLPDGSLDITIVLDSLLLPSQIDALQYLNITPMPNSLTATGSFSISIAEFSNVALVSYTPTTLLGVEDFHQVGTIFTINETTNSISWLAGTGYKSLMVRMNGSYADDTALTYQYLNVNATVTEATTIEFNIVGTKYVLELTPGVTTYQIDLTTPTSGNADLWKFDTGFNLLLTMDTTTGGEIILNSIELGN